MDKQDIINLDIRTCVEFEIEKALKEGKKFKYNGMRLDVLEFESEDITVSIGLINEFDIETTVKFKNGCSCSDDVSIQGKVFADLIENSDFRTNIRTGEEIRFLNKILNRLDLWHSNNVLYSELRAIERPTYKS